MSLICIDIGNSHTKAGIFVDGELVVNILSDKLELIPSFVKEHNVTSAAISSVVPERLEEIKQKLDFISLFIIDRKSKLNLEVDYLTPDTLGIDRVCSAEGAYYLHLKKHEAFSENNYLISVDLGTAATINIIKHPNVFIGGMIAPGIKTMFKSLHQNTAQLPLVDVNSYESLTGKSTKGSIASGVINSTLGLIEKTDIYLKEELSSAANYFYITGGGADIITPHLKINYVVEKALVLYGIYSIWKKNN